jgi:hypothetical protein
VALFNSALFNQTLFGGPGGLAPGITPVEVGQGLLYPALRKAQVTLGPLRVPSTAQFQDALWELNRLIGSLNCDRLNIYSIADYEFPLETGKMAYTIGLSPDPLFTADFPVERPQMIERANIVVTSTSPTVRYPLALFTASQWALIQVREIPDTIPQVLYNDRAYPISTLYLWGQPMAGYVLELFPWILIPTFRTITDVVLLPPGYEDALVLNLAVRLAPHFQKGAVPPDVREDAWKALMRLESINAPKPIAPLGRFCDDDDYNVYTDTWR